METKVSAVQVPCELAEKLETVAAGLDRSRDWIIEQVLVGFIDHEEERRRLTLEALASMSMPVVSSPIRPSRPGPTASRTTIPCR